MARGVNSCFWAAASLLIWQAGCAGAQNIHPVALQLHNEVLDLPEYVAHGHRRGLLAANVVSVGYGLRATVKVPANCVDALPYFNTAMSKLKASKGGILLILKGRYFLRSPFAITASNLVVKGAGMKNTILRLGDKAPVFTGAGFLTGTGLDSVTIQDLTLDGNKFAQVNTEDAITGRYGIYIDHYTNLRINRVKVISFQMYGIDPPARATKPGVDYTEQKKYSLTVTNCWSGFNNYDGYVYDTTVGVYCVNNTAAGNGRYGFNVNTGCWNVYMSGNVARDNGFGAAKPYWASYGGNGCGFQTDSNMFEGEMYVSTNIVYEKNLIVRNKRAGICSKGAKNVKAVENVISDAGQCAWFSETAGMQFVRNNCTRTPSKIVDSGDNKLVVTKGNTCDGIPC